MIAEDAHDAAEKGCTAVDWDGSQLATAVVGVEADPSRERVVGNHMGSLDLQNLRYMGVRMSVDAFLDASPAIDPWVTEKVGSLDEPAGSMPLVGSSAAMTGAAVQTAG